MGAVRFAVFLLLDDLYAERVVRHGVSLGRFGSGDLINVNDDVLVFADPVPVRFDERLVQGDSSCLSNG
jgi:hypothetical protein